MEKIASIKKIVLIYTLIVIVIWSMIVSTLAWWNIQIEKKITIETVINIARSSFNKDQAYRQWATQHGGVYVKPTKKTPPSPWMAHVENRDITTTDGEKLTLMNPAYMLREMMADYSDLYGIKGRIVGIVYLNKNNEADKWEAEAIKDFERGIKEKMELTSIEEKEYLRLMKPMIMNQKCQKCHGHLGFPNGSVRGGVSVSVPLEKYKQNEDESITNIIYTYSAIGIIGIIGIILTANTILKSLIRREEDLEEIIISSQVFNNTLDAIFITDKNANILRINKAFSDLTGYSEAEIIGQNPRILKSDYHNQEFYKKIWNEIQTKGFVQKEIWNRNKNGEIFVSIESITSIKDDNKNVKYYIATLHDITARKNAEERVVHMAHYDPLTDLPNRVLFQDRFLHALKLAKREKNKVALAFIDLDGFKKVNDTKGHQIGDKLLIEVSKIINNSIRESDTLCRLGGDEFTIIFENLEKIENIIPICQDILNSIKEEIILEGHSIYVSASIGISVYPDDGKNTHQLLQHADTAMYQSKDFGKDRISFYKEEMTKQALEKVELENSIRSALKNKHFKAFYQPKISLKNNSVIGMEALVRWIDPIKGLIPPNDFIPIAEEMHFIDKIDMYMLEEVCKDMETWLELGYKDIKVSVNLSGYDISLKQLYENILSIIKKYNIDPKNIEFEITETYFVNFCEENIEVLQKLKDFGFSLSIDDFGTGYSSLSNLQHLPINILKIDQSFIRTMDENSENQKLVNMIINLAKAMSLKTIAEGVETEYQIAYLRAKECDYIQGYIESKAIPKDEFIEYLKNR